MKTIHAQIDEIKEKLQNREDTDPAYMNEDLKEIRHWIMYTHLRVEQTLQVILGHHLFQLELKEENLLSIVENFKKVNPIFDNMEFYPKVKAIQKLGLLPKKLVSAILKVNDHRIVFSHPATYGDALRAYESDDKQLQTLNELLQVLEMLDKYILDKKLYIAK